MTPFYFGAGARRLFGLYTPAHASAGRQRGIVLCHPWGQEYLRAHRSMRQLGNLLAGAGYHVLRFDYFGTGDSGGDMTEADLQGWRADVEAAIDELKDTAGITRVSLLGLRLGGALAAQVAVKRRKDVDALVLWDPVITGADYVTELRCADELALARPAESGGGLEVFGFALTDAMARDLQSFDLMKCVPDLPARTFVAVSEPLASHSALKTALEARPAGPLSMALIDSAPAWLEDRHSGAGAVPVKLLKQVAEWLA